MSQLLDLRCERNIVPGNILLDIVLRYSQFINLNLYGSCRIGDSLDQRLQFLFFKIAPDLFAEFIVAYGTDGTAFHTELRYMIGEIGWCASYFLSFGEHIPQCFTDSYNDFIIHGN